MIPILISADEMFQNLYDTFVIPTFLKHKLDKEYEIYFNKLSKYDIGPYGFCTVSYTIYRQKHIQYLLSFLDNHPEHKHVISMDADMIFLQGFKTTIKKLIDQKNTSSKICLASDSDIDNKLPNLGLMILENSVTTKAFLKWLIFYIGLTNRTCGDLYRNIGEYISSNKEYKIFLLNPDQIVHNNSSLFTTRNRLLSREACCFHATSSANIYSKSLVLSQAMCFLEENGK